MINYLPNNKFLHWSKLKAFADNKINMSEKLKLCFGRVENIVRKRSLKNAVFFEDFFFKVVISRNCVIK